METPLDPNQLIADLQDVKARADLNDDEDARREVLQLSQALAASVKDPIDTATELPFSPFIATAAKIAVDLDLFGHIAKHNGPIHTSQLSSLADAEELLIIRIMRVCTSIGLAIETAQHTYAPNNVTAALGTSPVRSGHKMVFGLLIAAAVKAPQFLAETGYSCPTSPRDGFLQYAFQTKLPMFEYLASQPRMQAHFNNFMGNTMGSRSYWHDWYPEQSHLLEGTDARAPLLVDVGGGKGHDIAAFAAKFPVEERLVLQDLPEVLASDAVAKLDSRIERQPHDFFTEQPVKGARAYLLHHILHDWADKYCVKIIRALRPAMTPGYSRLLLHELILPDTGATPFQAIYDMTMMTFNAGMERSRSQWQSLLEGEGFQVQFYEQGDADGIVEAVLKE